IREKGYRYFTDYVRHHLGLAGILRIDHMMGLHRLFWIPKGMHARDGIYVKYHAEESYAVFTLESHRHKAMLWAKTWEPCPPKCLRQWRVTMSTACMYCSTPCSPGPTMRCSRSSQGRLPARTRTTCPLSPPSGAGSTSKIASTWAYSIATQPERSIASVKR